MTASDHLSQQQFMYHYTSPSNRASIMKHGLYGRSPDTGDMPLHAPQGIYLTTHRGAMARTGAVDTWRVDVGGLELKKDPQEKRSLLKGSYYAPQEVIRPDRLSLADRPVR